VLAAGHHADQIYVPEQKIHKMTSNVIDLADNDTKVARRDQFVGKLSAISQPTRQTQPFILPGSINE